MSRPQACCSFKRKCGIGEYCALRDVATMCGPFTPFCVHLRTLRSCSEMQQAMLREQQAAFRMYAAANAQRQATQVGEGQASTNSHNDSAPRPPPRTVAPRVPPRASSEHDGAQPAASHAQGGILRQVWLLWAAVSFSFCWGGGGGGGGLSPGMWICLGFFPFLEPTCWDVRPLLVRLRRRYPAPQQLMPTPRSGKNN